MDGIESKFEIELLKKHDTFELSSVQDVDLMRIRCFATHEGLNENGTFFSREVLLKNYQTLIDKPLVLVQDKFGMPTGHGYDFQRSTFDKDKRVNVGHVINAFPVIVDDSGNIIDISDKDPSEYEHGELRIICDLVLYKYYLHEVAEIILDLHTNGMLKFSIEGLMDCNLDDSRIKHCTRIQFTGLAIVRRPAFVNSHSLEVAEKQGGTELDFEKLYNDLKADHDTLIAEKAIVDEKLVTAETKIGELNTTIAEKIDALADKEIEISEAKDAIAELTPFKEKIETAEKLAVGEKRLERLTKLGYTEKSIEELCSMDQTEYSELLESVVDTASSAKGKIETAGSDKNILGLINGDTGLKDNKSKLVSLMDEICK